MKRAIIFITFSVFCGLFYFGQTITAGSSEEEAVKKPLLSYLKGHETGKAEYMKAAFHTEGKLMYMRDGKFSTIEFSDYIGRMKGTPAADEAMRKRHIESVDVSGNAAVGKIILDYPGARFVDYMTLLKIDGEWKIVNKAFYVETKNKD
ncbi:MAG: nuclear transport factor 2 family protein [Acidobacteriota bacterium]|nr:nuclear transport factor 2 family protein [Acidobacteriota bacterium]MDH3528287.1 nuclear transport factor 2 family protein [Acidobacteriota bacterium]